MLAFRRIFYCILAFSIASLPLSSRAFVKKQTGESVDVQKELRLARALNFRISVGEDRVKDELTDLKRRNKKMFQAELKDGVSNSHELQSYLYEVRDGRERVERGKRVAQARLYQAVQKNWKDLRNTILNDIGAENWKQFDFFLRDLMQEMTYMGPTKGKLKGLEFQVRDWGKVTVYDSNPRRVKVDWIIAVRSPHDTNTLPPNYNDISIQGEESED